RGDGAFGQYCMVLPELHAVVAITSGVRDMQATMNLVWDKLLPIMKADSLPADPGAQRQLASKLAGLTVRMPSGKSTAALAEKISGKWYAFPANERKLDAMALDLSSAPPALLTRTAAGQTRTPLGIGSWATGRGGFANGLERGLSVPGQPL